MNIGYIKSKIDELINLGLVRKNNKHYLLQNIEQIASMCRDAELTPRTPNFMSKFAEICNTVSTLALYSFKDAMSHSNYTDPIKFLNECWSQPVEIKSKYGCDECSLEFRDLYRICDSTEFFDSGADISAEMYLSGDFTKEDFTTLLTVAGYLDVDYMLNKNESVGNEIKREEVETTNEVLKEVNETDEHVSALKEVSSMFDKITTADAIRVQSETANNLSEETEAILNKLYKKMIDNAFCGCRKVSMKCEESVAIEQIITEVRKQGFEIEDVNEELIVETTVQCDICESYNEADLQKIAELPNAINLAMVADCCKYCIKPNILKRATTDVISALYRVTIRDSRITMQKIKTITNAYDDLYKVLNSKGFYVTDYSDYFVIRW